MAATAPNRGNVTEWKVEWGKEHCSQCFMQAAITPPKKKHFLGTSELEMPSDNLIFKTQASC